MFLPISNDHLFSNFMGLNIADKTFSEIKPVSNETDGVKKKNNITSFIR